MGRKQALYVVIAALLVGMTAAIAADDIVDTLFPLLQRHYADLLTWMEVHPILGRVLYMALFILVIGLYLPGGLLLMVLSGALFPFYEGLVIASLSNLAGAVIGMLLSRFFFYNQVRRRFPKEITYINRGLEANGAFYLFLLRLAPVIPSPVVNMVIGVTDMRLRTYAWVTLLARIPMTAIYVELGSSFATLESLSGLLSLEVLGRLLAIVLLAFAGNYIAQRFPARQRKLR